MMPVFRRTRPSAPGSLSLPPPEGRGRSGPPAAITAAAENIRLARLSRSEIDDLRNQRSASRSDWQTLAFDFFEQIGEVGYAIDLVANLCSNCRIYPGVVVDQARPAQHVADTPDLTPGIGIAAEAGLAALSGHPVTGPSGSGVSSGGIQSIIHTLSSNLLIAGEAYLIERPPRVSRGEVHTRWGIYSVEEVHFRGNSVVPRVELRTSRHQRASDRELLPADAYIARIWQPDPRFSNDPHSSLRAVLPLCSELVLLNQAIQALASSRLNAGVLYLPDGLSASATPPPDVDPATGEAPQESDEFEEALIDAMTTPIADPASASSVVPLLIRGPAELSSALRQLTFERPFDAELVQRADSVLDRILAGLSVPKDMIKGLADIRYSNAITIEQAFLKSTIDPMMNLVCRSLTTMFLHPYLQSRGYTPEQAQRVILTYDSSPIVNRPNKTADAQALYNSHALSGSAWRQAAGFSEADAPNPDELVRRLAVERAQVSPELFESLLRVMAPNIMEEAAQGSPAAAGLPPELSQALGMSPQPGPPPGDAQQPPPPPGDAPQSPPGTPPGPVPQMDASPEGMPTGIIENSPPQGGSMPPRSSPG